MEPTSDFDKVRELYSWPRDPKHRNELNTYLYANRFLVSFLLVVGEWLNDAFPESYDCVKLGIINGQLIVTVRTAGVLTEELAKLTQLEGDVIAPMLTIMDGVQFDLES